MINPTREQVAVALYNLLSTLTSGGSPLFNYTSRRPALWSNSVAMPALYMGNPMESYTYRHGTAMPPEVLLDFDIFIYINVEDPNTIPDTLMNNLLDAVEAAIAAAPAGAPENAQTLGGIVNHAWIEGEIHRAPGYINGQGMALFTIRALVPQ